MSEGYVLSPVTRDVAPARVGISIDDTAAGMYAHTTILTASPDRLPTPIAKRRSLSTADQ